MSRSVFNIAPLFKRSSSSSSSQPPGQKKKKKKNKYVKPFKKNYARVNRMHLAATSDPLLNPPLTSSLDGSEPSRFSSAAAAASVPRDSESAALSAIYSHLRQLHRTATARLGSSTSDGDHSDPARTPPPPPPVCHVRLITTHGNLNLELYPGAAPRATHTFIRLCSVGAYTGVNFHRLIPQFMIQGGRLSGRAHAPIVESFEDEVWETRLGFGRGQGIGVLGMANKGVGTKTNSSEFFITLNEDACGHLNGKHTVFGRVVGGFGTLKRMEDVGADGRDRPLEEIRIERTVVFSDVFQVLWRKWKGRGLGSVAGVDEEDETETVEEASVEEVSGMQGVERRELVPDFVQ